MVVERGSPGSGLRFPGHFSKCLGEIFSEGQHGKLAYSHQSRYEVRKVECSQGRWFRSTLDLLKIRPKLSDPPWQGDEGLVLYCCVRRPLWVNVAEHEAKLGRLM